MLIRATLVSAVAGDSSGGLAASLGTCPSLSSPECVSEGPPSEKRKQSKDTFWAEAVLGGDSHGSGLRHLAELGTLSKLPGLHSTFSVTGLRLLVLEWGLPTWDS